MKRILIRISALATVVVLGLIAIAQAQRSASHSAAVASSSTATSAPTGSERVEPIMALADAGAPRTLPATARANPLRPEPPPAVAADAVHTSATSEEQGAEPVEAIPETSPLILSAHDRSNVTAAGEPPRTFEGEPGAEAPAGVPDLNPLRATMMPPAPQEEALPQAAPPGLAPRQAPEEPPMGDAVPEASESRIPLSAGVPNEPEPFRADPFSRIAPRPNAAGLPADGDPTASLPPQGMSSPADEPGRLSPLTSSPLGNGTGTPGSKQLEGPQSPQITIEKLAPAEIQVGKPATFQIRVRNSGQIAAQGVEIHDEIPRGTRLLSTTPQATQGVRGELVWTLGTMQPGEELTAEVQLMPLEEGEIGSVATVQLQAEASVRTIATKPELVVETSAPSEVLVGEPVVLTIKISNPGSGVATGVVLEERVPPGLQHPAGSELEYDVGELKPQESRELKLQLVADRPGLITNVLTARADTNLKAEHRLDIQVLSPDLDLAIDGPSRRYLEREATYTVAISNPGTAPAQRVELVAQLPSGLKFVSANNAGHYNEADHTVHWQLDELPVQETGTVRIVTMPVEAGEHRLRVSASAEKGVSAEQEQPVLIEGIAALMFEVVDVDDPVEKGGETTYEIRIVNQGSKAATNVQLVVDLPPEMRPVAAEGPARHSITANRVLFDSLSRLAPKADTTYRVRVQCLQPGDMRVQVQLTAAELREPVTEEESTRVYSDD